MASGPAGPGLLFGHPACLEHDPSARMPMHPDVPERLRAIESRLGDIGWLGWERREAPAADEETLELVHDRALVESVRDLCRAGGGAIDPDTVVGEASFRAALHAAGGACEMARALLAGEAGTGFCAVRPSGHHAEPGRAMGFCLFDNVAIAAEHAVRELGAERAMVLDWDVHHGNGTAEAFRDRPDVLVAGIHQAGLYPGTGDLEDVGSGPGEGFTLNLPVPAGSEEGPWLALLEHVVLPVAREFGPDLILVSAGFDGHADDPLAGCRLESASFGRMARLVRGLGEELGAPVGAVLEGGYSPPALAESVEETLRALGGEGEPGSVEPDPTVTPRAVAALAPRWPVL